MLESLIGVWGYPLLLLGTVLEGETILVLAGYAAHRGYLSLPIVMAVALVGSIIGDLGCFALGRWKGPALLARRPALQASVTRFGVLLHDRGQGVIVILRFLYGLRVAGPFALGLAGKISPVRFLLLDMVGGFLWAPVVGGIGYGFGEVALGILHEVERYEAALLVGLIVVALGWRWGRRRRGGALEASG